VVEGAPLLRAYTLTGIEGSNPSLSANMDLERDFRSLSKSICMKMCGVRTLGFDEPPR
jgi:hypothetical protein